MRFGCNRCPPEFHVAADAALICYPMSGTRDGEHGDHVLLAPPFITTEAQVDEIIGKLKTGIAAVL